MDVDYPLDILLDDNAEVRQLRGQADNQAARSCRWVGVCAAGNSNRNRAPPPAACSTQILPPWFSIMERQIERPMPMPPDLVVNSGSKMRARAASAMPGPESSIARQTVPPGVWFEHIFRIRGSVARIASAAFTIKLRMTCCSWTASPVTEGRDRKSVV